MRNRKFVEMHRPDNRGDYDYTGQPVRSWEVNVKRGERVAALIAILDKRYQGRYSFTTLTVTAPDRAWDRARTHARAAAAAALTPA